MDSGKGEKLVRSALYQFSVYGQHLANCDELKKENGLCTCGFFYAQFCFSDLSNHFCGEGIAGNKQQGIDHEKNKRSG